MLQSGLETQREVSTAERSAMTDRTRNQDRPANLDDGDISLCQQGDLAAMERVYTTYRIPLFNLVFRFTNDHSIAEELLQDIFIKAFNSMGSLRETAAFKSWLYRLAINTCNSFLRKKKREKLELKENMESFQARKTGSGHLAYQLQQAVKSLAPKLRSVFVLYDVQGFSHPEIAEIMGWNVGTSKSQLFKARRKLRHLLTRT